LTEIILKADEKYENSNNINYLTIAQQNKNGLQSTSAIERTQNRHVGQSSFQRIINGYQQQQRNSLKSIPSAKYEKKLVEPFLLVAFSIYL